MKIFLSLGIGLAMLLCPLVAQAEAVKVTFTPPGNSEWLTDVLVSETSGDYSQAYGQRSEPGAETVTIGNLKLGTEYFFKAYRLVPSTWEQSLDSDEVAFTIPEKAAPVIHELPPIEVGNVVLDISIEVSER